GPGRYVGFRRHPVPQAPVRPEGETDLLPEVSQAVYTWPPPVPDTLLPPVSPGRSRPRGSTFSKTSSQVVSQAGPSALQMPVQEKQEPEWHHKDPTVQPGRCMMYYQPFSTTDPFKWTHKPTCSIWERVSRVALLTGL
uniref:Uncharacterized protein n=1 Tax=Mustela putorius furo TaxID=9669 RepID=M3YWA2_MUSPF